MFVYNVKLDAKKLVKIGFVCLLIGIIIMFVLSLYKIFSDTFKVRDTLAVPEVSIIEAKNYTNVLKSVYENLDTYIGQRVSFSGYVYRNSDFPNDQFVLARDMVMPNTQNKLIVGFLCSYKKAENFTDGSWVEIVGEITRGNYHGELPLLKVIEIKKADTPDDEFVPPPDSTYIPTSILY